MLSDGWQRVLSAIVRSSGAINEDPIRTASIKCLFQFNRIKLVIRPCRERCMKNRHETREIVFSKPLYSCFFHFVILFKGNYAARLLEVGNRLTSIHGKNQCADTCAAFYN